MPIDQAVEAAHLQTWEVLPTLRLWVNLSRGREPLLGQMGRLGCLSHQARRVFSNPHQTKGKICRFHVTPPSLPGCSGSLPANAWGLGPGIHSSSYLIPKHHPLRLQAYLIYFLDSGQSGQWASSHGLSLGMCPWQEGEVP